MQVVCFPKRFGLRNFRLRASRVRGADFHLGDGVYRDANGQERSRKQ